jgi:hypothetical protein
MISHYSPRNKAAGGVSCADDLKTNCTAINMTLMPPWRHDLGTKIGVKCIVMATYHSNNNVTKGPSPRHVSRLP